MSQSLSKIWIHIIFSTRNRFPFLTEETSRYRLHRYLAATCSNLNCGYPIVGGATDPIHILCAMPRTISLAKLIEELKKASSKWFKSIASSYDITNKFYWQRGYGAFSVSESHVPQVRSYIKDQIQHHKKITFKDEYRAFLRCYGISFDEKYLWD